MKKFDGIYKYSYNSIFGIWQIIPYITNESDICGMFQIKAITQNRIAYPSLWYSGIVGGRIFKRRIDAYQYMKKLECDVMKELNELFVEVGVK